MSGKIKMAHGSGGRLMHRLIEDLFVARFDRTSESTHDDAAEITAEQERYAFTADSFVVKPLFFPGGDIGRLAVCGTVNDLAAKGARAESLSASFVIEEGLALDTLERVVDSMAQTAVEAGVRIVTGDTKVVERGSADGLFVTTSGIGRIVSGANISGANAQPGDRVIVSGSIADHGAAVMLARQQFKLRGELASDCAPLADMICQALDAVPEVHTLRDPTRGGLATTLLEIAHQSAVRIVLAEGDIPIRAPVKQACDLLGLDPLYVANEGKMVAIVPESPDGGFLRALRAHPLGRQAAVIGFVEEGPPSAVLKSVVGGMRPLIMLEGDPLPRIC